MGETLPIMQEEVEGFPETYDQVKNRFFGLLAEMKFKDELDKMAMEDYFKHWFAEYDRAVTERPELKMKALSFIHNNSHSCAGLEPLTVLVHSL